MGSFIIVTEPLGAELARELIPRARLIVDTKNIGHYYRLTPDNRLMFGGRARFAPSDPESDKKSGAVLTREMREIFPQLARTKVEYVWGGSVGFAMDRIPHGGQTADGVYYSMGYAGHGVHMGRTTTEVMDGHPEANPVRGLAAPRIPLYNGRAWRGSPSPRPSAPPGPTTRRRPRAGSTRPPRAWTPSSSRPSSTTRPSH
nr:FAD-binding oxidoreductase [Streptomyces sp. NBC_00857]